MARRIPTAKVGAAIAVADESFDQLKAAFADLDIEARSRGLAVPVPA